MSNREYSTVKYLTSATWYDGCVRNTMGIYIEIRRYIRHNIIYIIDLRGRYLFDWLEEQIMNLIGRESQ